MDYFRNGGDPRSSIAQAKAALGLMAPLCERAGVRAVYQVHHGRLVSSASAAWQLVEGLPTRWIGVELDPGNQAFEGFECWDKSAKLLGEHLAALGVKDVAVSRDLANAEAPDKGWRREWVPIYEGTNNWYDVIRALKSIDFAGTMVFMPFYDENDPASMTAKLKREVAYLREVVSAVEAED